MAKSKTKKEEELEERIKDLEQQLKTAQHALTSQRQMANRVDGNGLGGTLKDHDDVKNNPVTLSLEKKGYLFKWQDRDIGWGGTKWALRFVSLTQGKLGYYRSHSDAEPRYVLTLKDCAVRDEGLKRNRRHRGSTKGQDPTPDTVGAYFHLFSIYQRLNDNNEDEDDNTKEQQVADTEIIPLLRFSTPSMAEKNQWMTLISEACAYCDTDEFLMQERNAQMEQERRIQQRVLMADTLPQAHRGTLPPLIFAEVKKPMKRVPSGYKDLASYRTKSRNLNAEDIDSRSVRAYPPSKPMHRQAAPSYLSAEQAATQNYRGLFNLGVILLIVSNARLLYETLLRHGVFWERALVQRKDVVTNYVQSLDKWHDYPILTGFALLQLFILGAYGIEWALSRRRVSNGFGMFLHHFNAHSCLAILSVIIWKTIESPFVGGIILFHTVILWMKLLSYALANEDYRQQSRNGGEGTHKATLALVKDLEPSADEMKYPDNITLSNLYYFWLAPTLTYQMAFPRSPRVRLWMVLSLVARFFVAATLLGFLMAQVIGPNLEHLVADLEKTNGAFTYGILAEYGFKLSIASCYCWLLVFYSYFHVYLNLFAELLRFGDRVFYKDWWNSSEVSSYWRLWNTPVHYWLVRHVYFPCVRMGLNKNAATLTVFFVSAIMHELLISVPFHMIRPWAYLGMMGQVPLVFLTKWITKKIHGTHIGNIIFWLSFCFIGQPMAILMYTIDYQFGKHPDTNATLAVTCVRKWWGGTVCHEEL